MSAPCFQYIKIASHDPNKVVTLLKSLQFDEAPIVLEITHLAQNQLSTLLTIEEFFNKTEWPTFPYSVYVLGDCPEYSGRLYLVGQKSQLPQFFNKKSRALNSKENTYYNKIALKQKNFQGLSSDEYLSTINKYAEEHRSVAKKQSFLVYLEKINKGLKEFYGQKK